MNVRRKQRMDEERPNVCGVCQEDFNPTVRCPRIFSCLHTLCTECIEKLINTKSKQCPFCRKNFRASEASEVRVNHTMLELMKVLSHQKSNEEKIRERQHFPQGEIFQHVKTETVQLSSQLRFKCKEVQQEMEQVLQKCQELHIQIRKDNDLIENALLPIIHRFTSDNANMLEELDTTRKELLMELEELRGKHAQLEEVEEKIEATSSFKEAGPIMDVSEKTSNSIREWIENSKEIIGEAESKLEVSKQASQVTREKITLMLEAHKVDCGMTNYTRYGIWVLVLTVLLVSFQIFASFYTPKENIICKSDDLPHDGLTTVEIDSSDRLLWMDSDGYYAKNLVMEQDCSVDSTVDLTLNTRHVDTTGLPVGENIIVDQNEKEKCAEVGKCNPFIVGIGEYGNSLVSEEEGSDNFANADLNKLNDYSIEPTVDGNIISDQVKPEKYTLARILELIAVVEVVFITCFCIYIICKS